MTGRRTGSLVLLLLTLAAPARAAMGLDARLSEAAIETGGTVRLIVTVTDPRGAVGDPQLELPNGLEQLGSARSQQFSWVNGRSLNQVTFRYEIGATLPGKYAIPTIRITVGGQTYRTDELELVVSTAAPPAVPGPRGGRAGTSAVASLVMTLEPREPVVGQACRLRVQLVQRVNMSEDSDYQPPATPGFWSETWGDPSRYQAREGRRSVIVTERSLRLYPLAPGPATISPAYATVSPDDNGLLDPLGGGLASSRIEIHSDSMRSLVRPLPAGAPPGFDGAVGRFELAWNADRSHTTQDQAITARLDVRGAGNLPLLRAPAYSPNDFDVFAATVDDSLPPPGSLTPGRRTFVWTLLPKRAGRLAISAPTFTWFDPEGSRYLRGTPATLPLEVLSARGPGAGEDQGGMPAVFQGHPARPGHRAAWPPVALAGGLLVAAGWGAWRKSRAPDPHGAARAQQREWLRSIGLTHGPDFWRAADAVLASLESRGEKLPRVREAVEAARYGGKMDQEEDVRRWLVERLGATMPPLPTRWHLTAATIGLGLLGVLLAAWSLPQGGAPALVARAAAADARARAGGVREAEAEWARLWDERPGDPSLAARLAWAALQRDDAGAAATWVLRGDRREARDPALRVIAARVRDDGGLVGAPGRSLPLRSMEWALLAFALALAAGAIWPSVRTARLLVALAVVAGAWWPAETAWRMNQPLAVVRSQVSLPPGDVVLDAGQVVRVLARGARDASVRATSDVSGSLPNAALWFLETR